ncbi:MAG: hypothetical protein WAN50_02965 [Minisyncoccia bacterium]
MHTNDRPAGPRVIGYSHGEYISKSFETGAFVQNYSAEDRKNFLNFLWRLKSIPYGSIPINATGHGCRVSGKLYLFLAELLETQKHSCEGAIETCRYQPWHELANLTQEIFLYQLHLESPVLLKFLEFFIFLDWERGEIRHGMGSVFKSCRFN